MASQPLRLRTTCDACLDAKVRCSRDKPNCTRCQQHGRRCAYSPKRKLGRPRGSSTKTSPSSSYAAKARGCNSRSSTPSDADGIRTPDSVYDDGEEEEGDLMGYSAMFLGQQEFGVGVVPVWVPGHGKADEEGLGFQQYSPFNEYVESGSTIEWTEHTATDQESGHESPLSEEHFPVHRSASWASGEGLSFVPSISASPSNEHNHPSNSSLLTMNDIHPVVPKQSKPNNERHEAFRRKVHEEVEHASRLICQLQTYEQPNPIAKILYTDLSRHIRDLLSFTES